VYVFARAFRGTHLGVALDFPMNSSPTAKEKDFAIKYDIPGGELHALVLNLQDIESDIRIVPVTYSNLDCEPSSVILCNLKSCQKPMRRGNMLLTCQQSNHCICADHIIPWKYDSEVPNLEIIQPFLRKIQQYVSKSQQTDINFLKTRALLSFDLLRHPHEISENHVIDALKIQARSCPSCLELKKNNIGLTIGQWNQQLFPSRSIAINKNGPSYQRTSNYIPQATTESFFDDNNNHDDEQTLDSICQELLLKGYSYDQISNAIENIPIEERMQIDSDLLEVLIVSTSPHFSIQTKKQLKKKNVYKISSPSSSTDNIPYYPTSHTPSNAYDEKDNNDSTITIANTSSSYQHHTDNNSPPSNLVTLPSSLLVTAVWPTKSRIDTVRLEAGMSYANILHCLSERFVTPTIICG